MTPTPPNALTEEEAIAYARIIDPEAWGEWGFYVGNKPFRRDIALSKARQIIALRSERPDIGNNIAFSPEGPDGNAVVYRDEPEGLYWTLIAQGGEGVQNAVAAEIARRLNLRSEWEGGEAAKRIESLEAQVTALSDALETFAILANEDTAHLPDELVVSLTFDDTAYDDDLGGPNTLLGELFLRAFRRAAIALRKAQGSDHG